MTAASAVAAPNAAASPAPSRRALARQPFCPVGKHMVHEQDVLIRTEPATRVFDKTVEPMRASTFLIEESLPRRARDESKPIDEVLEVVNAKFRVAEDAMSNELKRMETLAKDVGCHLPRRYINSESPIVVIGYSPMFFRYIDLLLQYDVLMQWLDSLWMGRAVGVKDRGEVTVRCRNLIFHLCREIQMLKERTTWAVERIEVSRAKRAQARAQLLEAKRAAREVDRKARRAKRASAVVRIEGEALADAAAEGAATTMPAPPAPADTDTAMTAPAVAPGGEVTASHAAANPVVPSVMDAQEAVEAVAV